MYIRILMGMYICMSNLHLYQDKNSIMLMLCISVLFALLLISSLFKDLFPHTEVQGGVDIVVILDPAHGTGTVPEEEEEEVGTNASLGDVHQQHKLHPDHNVHQQHKLHLDHHKDAELSCQFRKGCEIMGRNCFERGAKSWEGTVSKGVRNHGKEQFRKGCKIMGRNSFERGAKSWEGTVSKGVRNHGKERFRKGCEIMGRDMDFLHSGVEFQSKRDRDAFCRDVCPCPGHKDIGNASPCPCTRLSDVAGIGYQSYYLRTGG
jgi:hypothetical protein